MAAAKSKAANTRRSKTKAVAKGVKQKAGDRAAAAAKTAGAVGGRLSGAKKQLRDAMIRARVSEGRTYAEIAREAKVTTRTVERVIEDARKVRSPLEDAPMDLLTELATGHRSSIADFESMSAAWFDVNQQASLGAKKAADESRARLAMLLRDVGKLPEDLETFRSEIELTRIAQEMSRKMREFAAGDVEVGEVVEFFEGLIGLKPRLALVEGEGAGS